MASAACAVTARPHLPPALVSHAVARKLFFRCRAASTMDTASASSPDAEKKTTTVFVAGSTGRTGKRVVEKLLAWGFGVVAGTTDVGRARGSLPQDPNIQLVRADVMDGPDKLAEAVRGVDAVVCATGFWRSFDPFAPWKSGTPFRFVQALNERTQYKKRTVNTRSFVIVVFFLRHLF